MSIASDRQSNLSAVLPFRFATVVIIGLLSGILPVNIAHAIQPLGPPSPLPSFYVIEQWETATELPPSSDSLIVSPIVPALNRLCRFYGLSFDRRSPLIAEVSPLEWPRVFADQRINPRRLITEIESLMMRKGLAFRELVTLENNDTADSIARAVSLGEPVLLNVPDAAILYGYDRREPDPWWWVQYPQKTEIMFESERVQSLMYWTDDPASNLAWAVTGVDRTDTIEDCRDSERGYDWLRTILTSVRGDPLRGIAPYPLSLRAFRDRVASDTVVPKLVEPIHRSDPLGIRRARSAREQVVSHLEWLSQSRSDTLETEPLRLALYYYHNAVQSLDQLDTLLYNAQLGPISPATYQTNWKYDVRKVEIVRRIDELLEWEKQAAGEIGEAVSVVTPEPKKKRRK